MKNVNLEEVQDVAPVQPVAAKSERKVPDTVMPTITPFPAAAVETKSQLVGPRITVFGVGGGGGNAINNMIRRGLLGVRTVVCNTDLQALERIEADHRIHLGATIAEGLGAGSRPEVGRAAAEEALDEIRDEIEKAHMVVITAGMGGGTGTGAASVIARTAKELGVLTVAVVTKPFNFEGNHRMRVAEAGIAELSKHIDTLIVIPNQNLFRVADNNTTFSEAFRMADNVLYSGIRGVTDLIVNPGIINLDFADIRVVMSETGKAIMGTGTASGDSRATLAADEAISNPLLDDVSMKGARGVLINITGGEDVTLYEIDLAVSRIRDEVDPEANIIFGTAIDNDMNGTMRVTVVATGIDGEKIAEAPVSARDSASGAKAPVEPPARRTAGFDLTPPKAAPVVLPETAPAAARTTESKGFLGGFFGRKSKKPDVVNEADKPARLPLGELAPIRGGASRLAKPLQDEWSRPKLSGGEVLKTPLPR